MVIRQIVRVKLLNGEKKQIFHYYNSLFHFDFKALLNSARLRLMISAILFMLSKKVCPALKLVVLRLHLSPKWLTTERMRSYYVK